MTTQTIAPLPRDEDGFVITSAEFGMGAWFIEITYYTDENNKPVPEGYALPRTFHGPFTDEAEANEWADAYPDGDTDIEDFRVFQMNAVRPA